MLRFRRNKSECVLFGFFRFLWIGWIGPLLVVAFFDFHRSHGQDEDVEEVDRKLLPYRMTPGPTGLIKTVGSDTMNSLMLGWTEAFKTHYRGVRTEVEGQGSSKAMPSLIKGASIFGPMSRELKATEIEAFESRFGYKPTMLPVGIDLVAIFVHRDCPLEKISIEQIDAIFSATRKRGHPAIDTWGDLGLTGEWSRQPITLYGRNAASGTYGFFKDQVLDEGDFRTTVIEQPGSTSVVASISENRYAMGYSGIGFRNPSVKAIKISERNDDSPIEPTEDNALDGRYPLVRYLYLAMNYKPQSSVDPLRREFVKFVYSRDGQAIVSKDGYLPVNASIAKNAMEAVGISMK